MSSRPKAGIAGRRANRRAAAAAMALAVCGLAIPAGAQQPPGTTLPTVPVTPPADAAPPAKKAAPAPKAKAPQAKAATPPAKQEPAQVDPATALGPYNPALDIRNVTLPPGTTLTTGGPVLGYRALTAMSSTKTPTPIEEIPQSIQVLPRSLLDDQRPITVTETLQNVSNTQGYNTLNIGNTDLRTMQIRGFGAELWLDGMVVNYNPGDRDAFANIERIEVLKGPSAILYGGGPGSPVGGAVNIISKLPTRTPSAEFGVTFGSWGFARPYFDLNQPLSANGTILFRVTGEYTQSDSFIDVLEQKRYSINPTLTFTDNVATTLTIQARASRWEQQAYPGLPAVGTITGNFRIDRDMYIGPRNIIPSYTEVQGVTVTFDHRFDSVWSFNVKARWTRSEFDQNSQGPTTAAPDLTFIGPAVWSQINTEVYQRQQEFSINPNLQGRFNWGPTRNTVLVGADYSRFKDTGFMNVDFGVDPVDLLNPSFTTPYTKPSAASPFFFPFFDFNQVATTKGAYTQLQSSIFDRIHVLAGIRLASIDIEYFERVPFSGGGFFPPELFVSSDTKALPRLGVVVDLVKGLSVYASYSEAMRATGFTQAHTVAPEYSKQREAGIKFKAGELSGTVAVFEIDRSNIPVITGVAVAALSEQNSRGFEADLLWQLSRSWQILANYGYTNTVFADSLQGIPKGNHVPFVPEHSGRLWANYSFEPSFLKGWSIGSGIYVASGQYVDTLNVYKTDPYFTVDARLGYENEWLRAALHVKNLTGEEYFLPYPWFGGQVAPGAPRAIYGTISYRY